jgi:cell division protein FtsN
MKTFIMACVVAVIIAVIGGVVLNSIQEPVDKAFSTSAVRLGA